MSKPDGGQKLVVDSLYRVLYNSDGGNIVNDADHDRLWRPITKRIDPSKGVRTSLGDSFGSVNAVENKWNRVYFKITYYLS